MTRKTDEVVCPNPECEYYLKEEGKAIIKRGKYRTRITSYNVCYTKLLRAFMIGASSSLV